MYWEAKVPHRRALSPSEDRNREDVLACRAQHSLQEVSKFAEVIYNLRMFRVVVQLPSYKQNYGIDDESEENANGGLNGAPLHTCLQLLVTILLTAVALSSHSPSPGQSRVKEEIWWHH